MRGKRRVEIHPLVLHHHINTRVVLAPFLDERHRAFVDILLQRQRQQAVVQLRFLARLGFEITRVVAAHQVFDGRGEWAGKSLEQLLTVLRILDDRPVDGDCENSLVVRDHSTFRVEDAATFGRRIDHRRLRGGHLRLIGLALDALQEPQSSTQEANQNK